MTAPFVSILIALEARPHVLAYAASESGLGRLEDWISANPELERIVALARDEAARESFGADEVLPL